MKTIEWTAPAMIIRINSIVMLTKEGDTDIHIFLDGIAKPVAMHYNSTECRDVEYEYIRSEIHKSNDYD